MIPKLENSRADEMSTGLHGVSINRAPTNIKSNPIRQQAIILSMALPKKIFCIFLPFNPHVEKSRRGMSTKERLSQLLNLFFTVLLVDRFVSEI